MYRYLHLANLFLIIIMLILLVYFGRSLRNAAPEIIFSNMASRWFFFLGLLGILISIGCIVYYMTYTQKITIPSEVIDSIRNSLRGEIRREKEVKTAIIPSGTRPRIKDGVECKPDKKPDKKPEKFMCFIKPKEDEDEVEFASVFPRA